MQLVSTDKVSHCCKSKVLLTNGRQAAELGEPMLIYKGRTFYYICKKCHKDCYIVDENASNPSI